MGKKSTKSAANITKVPVDKCIEDSYSVYGEYVNTERAIPDFRDGLKPVQRRILWSMCTLNLYKKFAKSAKTVGVAIGNFHPHGDTSAYESLVNMTHSEYPLVEGEGNFGTYMDTYAAYRYTEARLSPLINEMSSYMDVAKFVPNFDGTDKEPLYFPSKLPFLLLNGNDGTGFGEGNTVRIPPHDIKEVLSAVKKRIRGVSDRKVIRTLSGPNYGENMGKILSSQEDVYSFYETGSGVIQYSCDYEFTTIRKVPVFRVKSWAPNFKFDSFINKCKSLESEGYIEYVSNNSAGNKVDILVGYRDKNVIIRKLLPMLRTNIPHSFVVLDSETKEYKKVTLLEYLDKWITYRKKLEIEYLNYVKANKETQLAKQKTLLNVITNKKAILKILTFNSGNALDSKLKEYGEPSYIKSISLGELSKDKKEKVQEKIASYKSDIQDLQNKMDNVDRVLLEYFTQASSRYSKKSAGMAYAVEESVVEEVEQKYYIAINDKGKIEYSLTDKYKNTTSWDFVIESSGKFIVFYPNNIARIYDVLSAKSLDIGFIGVVSDTSDAIIVIDNKGFYLPLRNFSESNKKMQKVFKDDREIVAVYGVNNTDVLYAKTRGKNKRSSETLVSDIKLKRLRGKPLPLLKWAGSKIHYGIKTGD